MSEAFLCDAVRTPFGRYGGSLSGVRADELAAAPIKALLARNPSLDGKAVDDVIRRRHRTGVRRRWVSQRAREGNQP